MKKFIEENKKVLKKVAIVGGGAAVLGVTTVVLYKTGVINFKAQEVEMIQEVVEQTLTEVV